MRIVPVVVGSILLLMGIFTIFAGVALFFMNSAMTASNMFSAVDIRTDSRAMVFKEINVNLGDSWWKPKPSDVATIRIRVSSNNQSNGIFLGIEPADDAQSYLRGVGYDELTDLSITGDPFKGFSITFSHNSVPGDQPLEHKLLLPQTQSFWEVSAHGTGTQALEWSPSTGTYWMILMNEDASMGVDAELGLGIDIPILSTIATVILVVAIAFVVGGVAFLSIGLRRTYPPPPSPPPPPAAATA